jgi:hypothetical protein
MDVSPQSLPEAPMPTRPTASPSSPRRVPLLLLPLHWVRCFFSRPLTLVREGGRWQIAFAPSRLPESPQAPAKVRPTARVPASDAGPEEPPNVMLRELRALLGKHADARQLLRHLAYVERTLRLDDADALDRLPPGLAHKALQQLEGLVDDWSTPGLAELRLRLAMARDTAAEAQPPAAERRTERVS